MSGSDGESGIKGGWADASQAGSWSEAQASQTTLPTWQKLLRAVLAVLATARARLATAAAALRRRIASGNIDVPQWAAQAFSSARAALAQLVVRIRALLAGAWSRATQLRLRRSGSRTPGRTRPLWRRLLAPAVALAALSAAVIAAPVAVRRDCDPTLCNSVTAPVTFPRLSPLPGRLEVSNPSNLSTLPCSSLVRLR